MRTRTARSLGFGLGLLSLVGAVAWMPAPAKAADAPVVVSGVVPDEATRQAILNKVRGLYGAQRVVDQLGVSSTSAPPNWSENVQKLLSADLKQVRRGHLRVSGNQVELLGEVDSTDISGRLEAAFKASLNPTYTIQNRLATGSAPQAQIDQVLQGKIIEFESGSAILTASGKAVLDELAPVLRKIEGKRIQVIGHTDASGPRLPNVTLSRSRAAAVKDYLVAQQIPAASIQTNGVGPDQPLVSNDTPENRARNRRIEVKVVP